MLRRDMQGLVTVKAKALEDKFIAWSDCELDGSIGRMVVASGPFNKAVSESVRPHPVIVEGQSMIHPI
ncbi:hypothetical protein VNO78_25327 [Psophocarpus tetragonolobus]|uniref:Uncharacterized protein n=1 Tax=Psophocarpus tetragonolobus TaxID=3891 RepID=A0AAN9XFQ5_PSOTE